MASSVERAPKRALSSQVIQVLSVAHSLRATDKTNRSATTKLSSTTSMLVETGLRGVHLAVDTAEAQEANPGRREVKLGDRR